MTTKFSAIAIIETAWAVGASAVLPASRAPEPMSAAISCYGSCCVGSAFLRNGRAMSQRYRRPLPCQGVAGSLETGKENQGEPDPLTTDPQVLTPRRPYRGFSG